jgi:polyphosphate:AMP phosphotransferase
MFETAEVGNSISKADFAREAPKVRKALLEIQKELAPSRLSVIIIVSGVEGAGKGETVNLLHEWMDARGMQTHALWDTTDEERERPPMWRFWRVLPPRGRIGILFGSWYTAPIIDRVFDRTSDADLDRSLERIVELERMLTNEDTLLLKFWMHLSKKQQKKRMRQLSRDPDTAWRVTKMDRKFFKRYDAFRGVSERALRRTSTGSAPWRIVEGQDARYRSLTVTRQILEALRQRLDALKERKAGKPEPDMPAPRPGNILRQLDVRKRLPDDRYETQLEKQVARLALLSRQLREARRSALVLFEGPDAAGKGGAIRRVISAIDARSYQVISVAAPTDEERAHPYLWRFWRHLPRLGRVTIYDRSWYGRVLVERLEGFCSREDWQRAYGEINAFEEQLHEFGIIVVKFWIAISAQEQLRRFKDREVTPYKQYKITEEDWRNRKKWGAYEAAACDMFEKTSTEIAPWVLVEGNDKNWSRIKVVRTVADRLEASLER